MDLLILEASRRMERELEYDIVIANGRKNDSRTWFTVQLFYECTP